MLDASHALADLLLAASRARELYDAVADAIDDARAMVWQTNWHARAAESFRDGVRAWCADLVEVREQISELERLADAAARHLQYRVDHGLMAVPA